MHSLLKEMQRPNDDAIIGRSWLPKLGQTFRFETNVRWTHVSFMLLIHLIAAHAIVRIAAGNVSWATIAFAFMLHQLCAFGLTAGVHRLWSHRAYKARLPLRIFLMLCQTLTFQKSIITWTRDHRIHHQHSETSRDPHNIHRGIFFAHMGWILLHKRPEVFEAGAKVDLTDLYADPVVRFQASVYFPLMVLVCFVMPTLIPVYCWNEGAYDAFVVAVILRHVLVLHCSFLINSYAHSIGSKRYDRSIGSTDNRPVAVLAYGEGFHNYHHSFPQDYSTSELKYAFNLTTLFIDAMAYIGQAYDLKRTSPQVVLARRLRTGDLSKD